MRTKQVYLVFRFST